jgi:hypothetical protein
MLPLHPTSPNRTSAVPSPSFCFLTDHFCLDATFAGAWIVVSIGSRGRFASSISSIFVDTPVLFPIDRCRWPVSQKCQRETGYLDAFPELSRLYAHQPINNVRNEAIFPHYHAQQKQAKIDIMGSKQCRGSFPGSILAVRNVSSVAILPLAERVQSLRPGNIANVPGMPFFLSP